MSIKGDLSKLMYEYPYSKKKKDKSDRHMGCRDEVHILVCKHVGLKH